MGHIWMVESSLGFGAVAGLAKTGGKGPSMEVEVQGRCWWGEVEAKKRGMGV